MRVLGLLASIVFIGGCGSEAQTHLLRTASTTEVSKQEQCSVTQDGEKAVILCPDGSTTILYPKIVERVVPVIQEVIREVPVVKETIREVPIVTETTQIVEVPVITEVIKEIYIEVPIVTEVIKEVEVPVYIETECKEKVKKEKKK